MTNIETFSVPPFYRWLFGFKCCQFFAFLQQFFGMSQVAAVTMLAVERVVVARYLYSSKYWTSNRTHWIYLGPLQSTNSVGATTSFDLKTEIDSVCEMLGLFWSTTQLGKPRNSGITSVLRIPSSEPFSISFKKLVCLTLSENLNG
jgi:hypothetical protein